MDFENGGSPIEMPEEELYKAVYRRRGMDLTIAATVSGRLQVTKRIWRRGLVSHYSHVPTEIQVDDLKSFLDKGGYKYLADLSSLPERVNTNASG